MAVPFKFPIQVPNPRCRQGCVRTSKGTSADAAAAAAQVMDSLSHPALLLVDGVSSIGGLDFQMDQWKVDMAVTGSQKALSLPTGLAVVAASPKVRARCMRHACIMPQRSPQHSAGAVRSEACARR